MYDTHICAYISSLSLSYQAECEELQARVEKLSNENLSLRDELQKLSEDCEKLTSENSSIKVNLSDHFLSFSFLKIFMLAFVISLSNSE